MGGAGGGFMKRGHTTSGGRRIVPARGEGEYLLDQKREEPYMPRNNIVILMVFFVFFQVLLSLLSESKLSKQVI